MHFIFAAYGCICFVVVRQWMNLDRKQNFTSDRFLEQLNDHRAGAVT